jgi:signal transduction histidine kinase/ligand-binding sensor domain-containing protein
LRCIWTSFVFAGIALIAGPSVASQLRIVTRPMPVIEGRGLAFQKLAASTGLSQTRVAQITQDSHGFLWFGTQYGLARFDGYRTRVFKHEPGHPASLSCVFVHALFRDRAGNIWAGCDRYLDRYDASTESFQHYSLTAPASTPHTPVTHICEGNDGLLWLATGHGLYRFDPASGRSQIYRHDASDSSTIGDNDIKHTGVDRQGRFWVAHSSGLDEFDQSTGRVKRHFAIGESGIGLMFHEDRSGTFWLHYGPDGTLATLDRDTGVLAAFDLSRAGIHRVHSILEDRQGTVWFATSGFGILRYDPKQGAMIRYRRGQNELDSLEGDILTTLFEDREGVIWAGLHQQGPNFFSTVPPMFEKFVHQPGNPNGLLAPLVSVIREDSEDSLWIGASAGLVQFNRASGQYTRFAPTAGKEVLSILEDGPNTIWFGTTGEGLLRYDRRTGDQRWFRHHPGGISSNIVQRLHISPKTGDLWAATWNGLNRCRRLPSGDYAFEIFKPDATSRGLHFYAITEDPASGHLWLGMNVGLARFDPQTHRFTIFRPEERDPASLSDNRVNSVFVDHTGSLWVGTQNGLGRYEASGNRFTNYYDTNGLAGNVVGCILEDARGALWMSTNRGVSRLDPDRKSFQNFTTADGLPGLDLTGWGACHQRDNKSRIYFGGFSGATGFHPDQWRPEHYAPPAVFTDFRLFGASVTPGRPDSPLQRSLTGSNRITLAHGQDVFAFEFSALSFTNPSTNRYRHRLDGVDRDWIETSSDQRYAGYTTLAAGLYTFRVQTATARGPWSEPGISIQVEILPPWWRSWWFLTLVCAAATASAWILYQYRIQQLTAQLNLRFEERLNERTRIAQELHDTLLQGIISASMQLHVASSKLPHDGVAAKPVLDRVLQLISQVVQDGRKAVQGLRSSVEASSNLDRAFSRIPQDFGWSTSAESREFRIFLHGKERKLHPLIRDEVYRIGREAIVNAIRHSGATRIDVTLDYNADRLCLTVQDNGHGMSPQVLETGREGHWGLPGMRERTSRIGGQLRLWSNPGAGTEVVLELPSQVAYRTASTNRENLE